MRISIYGLGYVGLTTVACSLKSGHEVHGVDVNADKVDTLRQGICPIFEPGLEEAIQAGLESGKLTLDVRVGPELNDADIAMVCVGTPSQSDGSHNMTHVLEVTRQIARKLATCDRQGKQLTLAYRSTMKPGSTLDLIKPILEQHAPEHEAYLELVYHPEFLRESTAIKDYFNPPKIVYGTSDSRPNAALESLYEGIEAPRFATQYPEAEMTKFVDNSFHGLKVAFANEIGRIAYSHGISAAKIHEIFISDTKLNISPYYLRPGGAFGGSCLPKDIRALSYIADSVGIQTEIIDNLINSNETHKQFLFDSALSKVKSGAEILLVGLAFKADSDDMRESPLMDFAELALAKGHSLRIYEPNFNADALHAANLNHVLIHLPTLSKIIVTDIEEVRSTHFDLLVDGRGNAHDLAMSADHYFDLSTLP